MTHIDHIMNASHPRPAFDPDTLVGNTDLRLAESGLFAPDWALAGDELEQEVAAILIDVWGFDGESSATHKRAAVIARMIARKRRLCVTGAGLG